MDPTGVFAAQRPRLLALAYRKLRHMQRVPVDASTAGPA